jgi:hypothetical protein
MNLPPMARRLESASLLVMHYARTKHGKPTGNYVISVSAHAAELTRAADTMSSNERPVLLELKTSEEFRKETGRSFGGLSAYRKDLDDCFNAPGGENGWSAPGSAPNRGVFTSGERQDILRCAAVHIGALSI